MDEREAKEIVARVCKNMDELWTSDHFWERAKQRLPGFTIQHIYQILRTGTSLGAPVRNAEHNNHVVRVQGKLPDYGLVRVILGLSQIDGAVCITVYEVKKGKEHDR